MTREEAVEILRGAIKKPNTKDGYLGQAIDMAIKALEQEPCEDCISREWLKEAFHNFFYGLKHHVTEEDIQAYIDVAPSVTPQPKTGHWIPVSERLPEENKSVIASTKYCIFPEARYTKRYGWEWVYDASENYWEELEDVTAWMPLPKLYNAENEG